MAEFCELAPEPVKVPVMSPPSAAVSSDPASSPDPVAVGVSSPHAARVSDAAMASARVEPKRWSFTEILFLIRVGAYLEQAGTLRLR